MNTYTTRVNSSSGAWVKPACIVSGAFLCITILGFPFGIIPLILGITSKNIQCGSCKKMANVMGAVVVFRCYNCQEVNAMKHGKWKVVK